MKKIIALALSLAMLLAVAACAEGNPSTRISDELVEITIMRDDSDTQPLSNDALKWGHIEKLLNVRVNLQTPPKADYTDKKQVLIATGDMPDIMMVSSDDVKKWAREGVFVNLSERKEDMPNMFAVLATNPGYAMLTVDSDFYGAPVIQRIGPEHRPSGQLVNVRTDLLAKYNIDTPTTWDELFEAILTIQENEPGLVGITNRKGGSTTATRKMLDCMGYPLGASSDMYYDEDLGGVWVYGPASENFKAVLEYLNKCYEAGVLDPDYASMTKDQWTEKLSSGNAICTVDNDGVVRGFNLALQSINPEAKIEVIPTLTNSLDQTRNFRYDVDWLTQAYVISADSKHVDVCVKFLDWCYSDQGADVNGFGIEGVTYEIVDGRETIKTEYLEKYKGSSSASSDLQSELGVGLLDVTPYVDIGAQEQMSLYQKSPEEAAEFKAQVAAIAGDEGLRAPVVTPPLSEEATERYNELHVAIETYVYQEIDKYITGEEPIDNFDNVIEHALELGLEEMEAIYNDAWNEALGK